MSGPNDPNTVDFLTLGAAIVAPLVAAWTTIWSVKRSETEKFNLHIDWKSFLDDDHGYREIAYLYVQNVTEKPIIISSIQWYRGAFRRKRCRETALPWEDPFDLNFPYTVEPNSVREFAISEAGTMAQWEKVSKWAPIAGLAKRSSLWIGVSTVSGKQKFIGAEGAIPWSDRPKWTKVVDDD